MLPPKIRPVVVVLLVLLPVAIFGVILSYLDPTRIIADTPQPKARWVDTTTSYSSCAEAASGTRIPNRLVDVDEVRAARIGAGVIESQTTLPTIAGRNMVAIPPVLVERSFPDGQSHLTWVYGQGRVTDSSAMSAQAAFVYIDAASGEPLLLIGPLYFADPSFTCSELISPYRSLIRASTLYINGGLIIGAYLLIVGGVALFLRKRSQRKAQLQISRAK